MENKNSSQLLIENLKYRWNEKGKLEWKILQRKFVSCGNLLSEVQMKFLKRFSAEIDLIKSSQDFYRHLSVFKLFLYEKAQGTICGRLNPFWAEFFNIEISKISDFFPYAWGPKSGTRCSTLQISPEKWALQNSFGTSRQFFESQRK